MIYFKWLNPDGSTLSVEENSFGLIPEGAIKITKAEFDAFIALLPVPPAPEPCIFDPPPGTGTPKRLDYIEEFLKRCYPKI